MYRFCIFNDDFTLLNVSFSNLSFHDFISRKLEQTEEKESEGKPLQNKQVVLVGRLKQIQVGRHSIMTLLRTIIVN